MIKSNEQKNTSKQAGFAMFLVVLLVLSGGVFVFAALAFSVLNEVRIGRNALLSAEAYYAAEAGIEDALLRLQPARITSSTQPYTLNVASSSVTVSVGSIIGGTRNVIAQGTRQGLSRRVSVNASLSTTVVSFAFGAHIGEGGLKLAQNSIIEGNVFSNGDVIGNGATTSQITETVVVSGNHKIQSVAVGADAYADVLINCTVGDAANYVASITSCPAGSTNILTEPPEAVPFPISDDQINAWKYEAESGGILSGYTLGNNQNATLGFKKIEGDMTLGNNSVLTLTGTIWVTGTITFGNAVVIKLDQNSYGGLSGVIIADSAVSLANGADLQGAGQPGSYLMLLVTASGVAIDVQNSAAGSVLYAPNGTVFVGNNMSVREATAYRLETGNNTVIQYESGLAAAQFTSGPSAGFRPLSWTEIQ